MRRIHQVIILVIAFFSLIAFLAYKHEYDRLKNILQVLNTFGHDSKNCGSGGSTWNVIDHHSANQLNVPFGEWRQFDLEEEGGGGSSQSYHFYSAFYNHSTKAIRIHGITNAVTDHGWNRCGFYKYDVMAFIMFRLGKLKIKRDTVKEGSKWVPVMLQCDEDPDSGDKEPLADSQPIAVYLIDEQKRMTPVMGIEIESTSLKTVDSVAICTSVMDGLVIDEGMLIQFIEYHRYAGVNRFFIYTDALTLQKQNEEKVESVLETRRITQSLNGIRLKIEALLKKNPDLRIEVLHWNVPFTVDIESNKNKKDAANVIMRRDCLDRVGRGSSYVVFLELYELFVCRYHSHLLNFVKDEANVIEDPLGGLRLTKKVFCQEFPDDEKHMMGTDLYVIENKYELLMLPPMFKKTKYIDNVKDFKIGNETLLVKTSAVDKFALKGVPILTPTYSFRTVDPDFASIHVYIRCNSISNGITTRYSNHTKYDDIVIEKVKTQFL